MRQIAENISPNETELVPELTDAPTGPAKGSYVLVLHVLEQRQLRVGKLGTFRFPAGCYLYFGSALNSLNGRIGRHLRKEKKPHWHIDHLVAKGEVVEVWAAVDGARRECEWAGLALDNPLATVPAKGFGSSDCRTCPAHLVYLPNWPAVQGVKRLMRRSSELHKIWREPAESALDWVSSFC